jgi:3-deoxy-manno-octulosonate cytidylyltransferase (CMP-KDO synthetase)
MKVACIIPARLNSTRFPKKILSNLAGKPLLQWVWEAATRTTFFNDVLFAIDSEETASVIKNFGGRYVMTSDKCKNGTERLIEVVCTGKVKADVWVNWQADEPFIKPEMIGELLQSCSDDIDQKKADIWTLKKRIKQEEDVISSNVVKVVCDAQQRALYFSRSVIPFYRDEVSFSEKVFYQHIGLYAYTTKALRNISILGHSYLESAECLEQLCFLHHGMNIKVHQTLFNVIGIDTLQDFRKAENFAKSDKFSL